MQASADTTDPGCHNGDCSSGTVAFKLRGLEIFKGIDIGSVRCGTTFVGRVFQNDYGEVGYWKSVICYTGAEFIEECEGKQDILRFNLEVVFYRGSFAGHRLVLRLIYNPDETEDVFWGFKAPVCGPAIQDPECACPNNPCQIVEWNCDDGLNGDGPIAALSPLELTKSWGSTLDVKCGQIEGWLCHNWAFIPRVNGTLRICLN